jgi:hypothetical protein
LTLRGGCHAAPTNQVHGTKRFKPECDGTGYLPRIE